MGCAAGVAIMISHLKDSCTALPGLPGVRHTAHVVPMKERRFFVANATNRIGFLSKAPI
jgi:hypothetical protein